MATIEIIIDANENKLYIKDGLITFDNETIDLVDELEKVKLVGYMWGHTLEGSRWGVVISKQSAFEQLVDLGVEVVPYNQSPQINRGDIKLLD
jgi:hypothetical protein